MQQYIEIKHVIEEHFNNSFFTKKPINPAYKIPKQISTKISPAEK